MKTVLLSHDGDVSAYEVPDHVANNILEYALEFDKWLWNSPHAKKYHLQRGVCYNDADFIEYLNIYIFPEEPSRLIETIGEFDIMASKQTIPEKYKDCVWFNF